MNRAKGYKIPPEPVADGIRNGAVRGLRLDACGDAARLDPAGDGDHRRERQDYWPATISLAI
jgi:hypothetical protein